MSYIEQTRINGQVVSTREVSDDGAGCAFIFWLLGLWVVVWFVDKWLIDYPWIVFAGLTVLVFFWFKYVVKCFRKVKNIFGKIIYAILGVWLLYVLSGGVFNCVRYIINPSSRCEDVFYPSPKVKEMCKQDFSLSSFDPRTVLTPPIQQKAVKSNNVKKKSNKKSTASGKNVTKTKSQ